MATPRVKDWMTRRPITVQRGLSLTQVRQIMEDEQIRRLLVLDEDGSLLGVITSGDVREAWPSPVSSLSFFERKEALDEIPVDDVMHDSPITVHPDATIQEAADLMFQYKIGGLPVVDDGELVGVITQSDLMRGLVRMLDQQEKAARAVKVAPK